MDYTFRGALMKIEKRLNYIGSKYLLLDFIFESITKTVDMNVSDAIFCDMFAGSSVVGRFFKLHVKQVISNDLEYYSYILAQNYMNSTSTCKDDELFNMLNKLEGIKGFIYTHYSQGSDTSRLYFSAENGKKIDAIREKIESLYQDKTIDKTLYFHLLASLIESADVIANTASVYSAYLKTLKKTAKEPLVLIPASFEQNSQKHTVYNQDANKLITTIQGDILYLDPPYNIRQYGSNYHILNTIAKYDTFTPSGITGVRDYTRSTYCSKKHVHKELEYLIKEAKFKYIFMSYSSDGILTPQEIKTIFQKYGEYRVEKRKHHRFKAQSKKRYTPTTEFLHILLKP